MTEHPLLVSHEGPVRVLTLNRPTRLNALSPDLVDGLLAEIDDLRSDRECRVVVLTGAGGAFSAGADLKDVADGSPLDGGFESALRLCWGLRRLPQPLIAAVEGVAVGAGLSLACAADIRIAARDARFGAVFVRVGLSGGDGGSSFFLPRIVGWEHAADLLYTGRIVDADEALRIGLVGQVVESGAALASALELAEQIATRPPAGLGARKALLNVAADGGSLERILELDARSLTMLAEPTNPSDVNGGPSMHPAVELADS